MGWFAACFTDQRDPRFVEHKVEMLVGQRVFGLALGYEDLNDRQDWPRVRITLRGDSGFAREALMTWCEDNGVDYVFGLAGNRRLEKELAGELAQAKALCEASGKAARLFRDFRYQTLDSWSKERRVAGKAEHTLEGANPRYVVTTLNTSAWDVRALYEDLYCARGKAENRIGEQFELFADRASCETMACNVLRMQFSALAYG